MKRSVVQEMLRHALPRNRWMTARQILDYVNTHRVSLTGASTRGSWKHFPPTTASLVGKIKGMRGLVRRQPKGDRGHEYMLVGVCMLCPSDAETNDGLCIECFNDMMDERHADYVAMLHEVNA
jgi:hypothetical protein